MQGVWVRAASTSPTWYPPHPPLTSCALRLELSAEPVVLRTVHYVSRLADTQQVLVDTRDEGGDDPVPLVAGRGAQPFVSRAKSRHPYEP